MSLRWSLAFGVLVCYDIRLLWSQVKEIFYLANEASIKHATCTVFEDNAMV